MSGTEGVTQLHSDVDDITSALQTLLEKREMYASMLAKLDTEEHGVVRRLQDSRARFRGLAALGLDTATDAAAASAAAPEHVPTPRTRALGTITNDAAWDHLVECCPALRVAPPVVGAARHRLAGPATEDVYTLGTSVAARTISTYPMNADRTKRQGSPICDQYNVVVRGNRVFVCVADGCNWGEKPREAARRASASFVDYLDAHYLCACDAHDVGALLLDAFVSAHNAVVAGISEAWEAGTTTLVGAAVFPLALADDDDLTTSSSTTNASSSSSSSGDGRYGVCVLSIGDCKCFVRDARSGRVRDVTAGNRGNLTDATDPGGRIGPYLDGGMPDTRNLALFFARCGEDDVLVLCSDGVHDNLDPQSLGVDPGDLAPAFAGRTWDEACALDGDLSARVKERFAGERLAALVGRQTDRMRALDSAAAAAPATGDDDDDAAGATPRGVEVALADVPRRTTTSSSSFRRSRHRLAPEDICREVTDFCARVTTSSRAFMESNPKGKLPKDFKRYPGKMDHTTCVAIQLSAHTLFAEHAPSSSPSAP